MAYVAPMDLMDWPGVQELAQVATPEDCMLVDTELMRATLASTSRSAWPADQIAIADRALANIAIACTGACAEIDSYLAMRYPLPLTAPHAALQVWGVKLARYRLHKNLRVSTPGSDGGQHPIHRDYDTVISLLEKIAAGKLSLGANDPSPPTPAGAGATYIEGEARSFSRENRRRAM